MKETVGDVGEFGLISRLCHDLIRRPESVVVGAGDDGAVYRLPHGMDEVISTDTMVEGIHFTKETMAPEDVGWKLCIANFSDMAAMGAEPREFVVAASLPADLSVDWISRCYDGIRAACAAYGVNLLGGDVTGSRQGVVLTGTVVGVVPKDGAVRRSGARVGDVIFLSDTVGDAAAGLAAILAGDEVLFPEIVRRHRRPTAEVETARILREAGAHALNDVTDGVASEANEIAAASGVNLILAADAIPVSSETEKAAKRYGTTALSYALSGGEDYALLGTMAAENFETVRDAAGLVAIGRVAEGSGQVFLQEKNDLRLLEKNGYNHFRK